MLAKDMNEADMILIVLWIVLTALWAMTVWGGWAERVYESSKDTRWTWFWLRTFKVPTTKENCLRFDKCVSLLGIALGTLGIIARVLSMN
jgi:hypothetical protein